MSTGVWLSVNVSCLNSVVSRSADTMMKVGKSWGRGILFLISAVSNDSVRNINIPLRFIYLEYPLQEDIYS